MERNGHVLDDAFDDTSVVRARGERVDVDAGDIDRVAHDQVPERIGEGDADMAEVAVRPFVGRHVELLEAPVHLPSADTVDVSTGAASQRLRVGIHKTAGHRKWAV